MIDIENDPRLTAYVLGALCEAERLIFEQDLANAGGAEGAIAAIRDCADGLRAAFAAEPLYGLTGQQRAAVLAEAGVAARPIVLEEAEVVHTEKVLPWVTQPVISEVDKRRIAEALRPAPWRRALPWVASIGTAVAALWLVSAIVMHQPPVDGGLAEGGGAADDELPAVGIGSFLESLGGEDELPVPAELAAATAFRYGEPQEGAEPLVSAAGQLWRNPSFARFRRSALPVLFAGKSYDMLRHLLDAGRLPEIDEVRVAELLNAYEYDYAAPADGETFAVASEVAPCPWDPARQLVKIGLRAAGEEGEAAVAEDVRMAVEFNPAAVAGYRLIGSEVDDGGGASVAAEGPEVPGGHTVTALYEVVPQAAGGEVDRGGDEIATVSVEYKNAVSGASGSVQATVTDAEPSSGGWRGASDDLRFAASVAGYGLLLGAEEGEPLATYDLVRELARDALGDDKSGKRKEFLEWVEKTIEIDRQG